MTEVNFESILDQNVEDIKEPKSLPPGTYAGELQSAALDRSAQKKTPLVRFVFRLDSAMEDVDEAALEEAGGLVGAKGPKTVRKEIYYSVDNASWNFEMKQFLESCGLETPGQFVNGEGNGRSVLVTLKHSIQTHSDNTNIPEGETRVRVEVARVAFQ